MKTLQELYNEIIGSEELKKAYLEATKGDKIAEFLKAQGCEAKVEEIKAFLKERGDQELSDAELDSVAGGGCNMNTKLETILSVSTVGVGCATLALHSVRVGHTGQQTKNEGRLCNSDE